MTDNTKIEWSDATWNPVTGCTKVSAGCDHCYAETFSERFRGTPGHYFEGGFDLQLRPDKLDLPLRWTRPRKVFVNSMSDLFHDDISADYIIDIFAVMAMAQQHTFQVLTKRHGRMRSLLSDPGFSREMWDRIGIIEHPAIPEEVWPLSNVWLGVSAEDQKWANIRIPALADTPAAVRFVSAEPLLGPIDFVHIQNDFPALDWVIVGGESGRGARPMNPVWAQLLRDQCQEAGIAYLFKQWGEWTPETGHRYSDFHQFDQDPATRVYRVGKRHAGRMLDGRTWDQYPTAA